MAVVFGLSCCREPGVGDSAEKIGEALTINAINGALRSAFLNSVNSVYYRFSFCYIIFIF